MARLPALSGGIMSRAFGRSQIFTDTSSPADRGWQWRRKTWKKSFVTFRPECLLRIRWLRIDWANRYSEEIKGDLIKGFPEKRIYLWSPAIGRSSGWPRIPDAIRLTEGLRFCVVVSQSVSRPAAAAAVRFLITRDATDMHTPTSPYPRPPQFE